MSSYGYDKMMRKNMLCGEVSDSTRLPGTNNGSGGHMAPVPDPFPLQYRVFACVFHFQCDFPGSVTPANSCAQLGCSHQAVRLNSSRRSGPRSTGSGGWTIHGGRRPMTRAEAWMIVESKGLEHKMMIVTPLLYYRFWASTLSQSSNRIVQNPSLYKPS